MTKKNIFVVSLVSVGIFTLLALAQTSDFCYREVWCNRYWDEINAIGQILFLSFPLLLFSTITYFLREEVFRAWLHFTYWWIPVSFVFIYLARGWSGGGFGIPNVLDQESVSIIFSGLFTIISLFIILVSWVRHRRER